LTITNSSKQKSRKYLTNHKEVTNRKPSSLIQMMRWEQSMYESLFIDLDQCYLRNQPFTGTTRKMRYDCNELFTKISFGAVSSLVCLMETLCEYLYIHIIVCVYAYSIFHWTNNLLRNYVSPVSPGSLQP
jgi:hypothetical protein